MHRPSTIGWRKPMGTKHWATLGKSLGIRLLFFIFPGTCHFPVPGALLSLTELGGGKPKMRLESPIEMLALSMWVGRPIMRPALHLALCSCYSVPPVSDDKLAQSLIGGDLLELAPDA